MERGWILNSIRAMVLISSCFSVSMGLSACKPSMNKSRTSSGSVSSTGNTSSFSPVKAQAKSTFEILPGDSVEILGARQKDFCADPNAEQDGSELQPYLIFTNTELTSVLTAHPATSIHLCSNLDFSGATLDSLPDFVGSFDGEYHTISNAVINGPGLFKSLTSATIRDLRLNGFSLSTPNVDLGALAGRLTGGGIYGVGVYGSVITQIEGSTGGAGGLIGVVDGTHNSTPNLLQMNVIESVLITAYNGSFSGGLAGEVSGHNGNYIRRNTLHGLSLTNAHPEVSWCQGGLVGYIEAGEYVLNDVSVEFASLNHGARHRSGGLAGCVIPDTAGVMVSLNSNRITLGGLHGDRFSRVGGVVGSVEGPAALEINSNLIFGAVTSDHLMTSGMVLGYATGLGTAMSATLTGNHWDLNSIPVQNGDEDQANHFVSSDVTLIPHDNCGLPEMRNPLSVGEWQAGQWKFFGEWPVLANIPGYDFPTPQLNTIPAGTLFLAAPDTSGIDALFYFDGTTLTKVAGSNPSQGTIHASLILDPENPAIVYYTIIDPDENATLYRYDGSSVKPMCGFSGDIQHPTLVKGVLYFQDRPGNLYAVEVKPDSDPAYALAYGTEFHSWVDMSQDHSLTSVDGYGDRVLFTYAEGSQRKIAFSTYQNHVWSGANTGFVLDGIGNNFTVYKRDGKDAYPVMDDQLYFWGKTDASLEAYTLYRLNNEAPENGNETVTPIYADGSPVTSSHPGPMAAGLQEGLTFYPNQNSDQMFSVRSSSNEVAYTWIASADPSPEEGFSLNGGREVIFPKVGQQNCSIKRLSVSFGDTDSGHLCYRSGMTFIGQGSFFYFGTILDFSDHDQTQYLLEDSISVNGANYHPFLALPLNATPPELKPYGDGVAFKWNTPYAREKLYYYKQGTLNPLTAINSSPLIKHEGAWIRGFVSQ